MIVRELANLENEHPLLAPYMPIPTSPNFKGNR
jgi:hypothetical protein